MKTKLWTPKAALLGLLALPLMAGNLLAGGGDGFDLPDTDPEAVPVTARLLADAGALVPGTTVTLGVHLRMESGWHTYWKNSGDAGYPTEVDWDLPEGFVPGELQWPAPHRYSESFVPGESLTTYGYGDDVVLFTDVRIPADLPEGEHTLKADVSWLMCKDLCIPGDAQVEITLSTGSDALAPPADARRLIDQSRARLPQDPATVDGLGFKAVGGSVPLGGEGRVSFSLAPDAGADWTWFPEYEDALEVGEPTVEETGRLKLSLPVTVTSMAEVGADYHVRGLLEAQRGGETLFLELSAPVGVVAEGAAASSNEAGGLLEMDFRQASATGGESRSLLYYLALALVGGIILNVMPCVLPVLSIKVMGFVSHAGEEASKTFRLGLMFALGVLVSFLALAMVVVGLQAAGDQLGWGFQFQNPIFVVVMAAIVFAFGLSLFGVFEVILPIQMGGGVQSSRSEYAESFFHGVLATALATPCTAPFLGTALGFAFTQPAVNIIAIFLMIGVGLALPYVVLAINPAWLRFVPKPGAWMERFKQAMGFLLMATVIWLLWVLGQQLGPEAVVWTLAFLLALGLALWLYGALLDFSSGTARRFVVWSVMFAVVIGSWMAFLQEPLGNPSTLVAASTPTHEAGGLQWETFSPAALEQAVNGGETVFVDFTAAWCWTCKVNERTVLRDDDVLEKFRQLEVRPMMGDWTNKDPVITQVLRSFGRSGVPFYVVFPANRLSEPIVLPEVITAGRVIEALEQAGPSLNRSAALDTQ